ncbi:MAG: glycosyltransferase family 4 protein [Candidatus Glassbacteria bacterium]
MMLLFLEILSLNIERLMGTEKIIFNVFLVFVIALLFSLIVTPLIWKLALRLQEPKTRERFVPELGGIAIFLSFMVGLLIAVLLSPESFQELEGKILGMVLGGTTVLLVGVYDDIRGTNCLQKFMGQTLAALIAIYFGFNISMINNPFGEPITLGFFSIPVTLLWIVGISNAINLIDGLDGLAAGVASVTGLTLFLIATYMGKFPTMFLTAILVGSILGFLKYNFNPAMIFMGDTGSLFLGFLLALISIQGSYQTSTAVAILIPIIALGVPIVDTLYAIFRRARKGVNPLKGDKEHIHHRLLNLGLTHKQAVMLIYGVSMLFGIIAFLLTAANDEFTAVLLLIVGIIVYIGVRRLGYIEFTASPQKDFLMGKRSEEVIREEEEVEDVEEVPVEKL